MEINIVWLGHSIKGTGSLEHDAVPFFYIVQKRTLIFIVRFFGIYLAKNDYFFQLQFLKFPDTKIACIIERAKRTIHVYGKLYHFMG